MGVPPSPGEEFVTQYVFYRYVSPVARSRTAIVNPSLQVQKRVFSSGVGGTPYIRMIGRSSYFLGVVMGNLVFFRGCSSKFL